MRFLPSKIIVLHQINSWTLKMDTGMKAIFQPINGRVNIDFGECGFYKKRLNRTWNKIKEVSWFENLGRWMGSRSFMGNISLKLDALYQLSTGFVWKNKITIKTRIDHHSKDWSSFPFNNLPCFGGANDCINLHGLVIFMGKICGFNHLTRPYGGVPKWGSTPVPSSISSWDFPWNKHDKILKKPYPAIGYPHLGNLHINSIF